jgi:hypothetical protein
MDLKYPEGFDLCWVAFDQRDQLAAFITAAQGPIPVAALSEEGFSNYSFEDEILAMPVNANEISSSIKSFRKLSERGFYVFDWKDISRPRAVCSKKYELAAKPRTVVNLKILPPILAYFASKTRLPIDFASTTSVDIVNIVQCKLVT